MFSSGMTPEETKALQAHLEAAAILFKNTPAEQQDFESIERSVRDHLLEQVSPQIGIFFYAAPPELQQDVSDSSKLVWGC